MKKENKDLIDERQHLKVAADKYQKRAIYVRKKFAELQAKSGNVNYSHADPQLATDSKYRLKCSQLQKQLKEKEKEISQKNEEVSTYKQKVAQMATFRAFRIEATKLRGQVTKLSSRLIQLEKDAQKRK